MDRLAGILDRREPQYVDLPGFRIHTDIRHVDREARTGTARVQRRAPEQRTAGASRVGGDLRQRERLDVGVHARLRNRLSVLPVDQFLFDPPCRSGALLALRDDVARCLNHRHAGGKCDAAAAGDVVVAGALGVGDQHAHAFVWNAQLFSGHQRHRRARTADVGAALDHGDGAVLVDVNFGARLHACVEPETGREAATFVGSQFRAVVRMLLRRIRGIL